ncbi:CPBP family intramembrane glutamic endopeptidase [Anaeromicrobium sediminis]|uniref:CAAX prenyl protease 2/Lysostaphin resistance protein A-like domain-containing protein n=1 Tax=Anaeromicrobium sediminis TaxID=1478221 RepID=A0A267MJ20_9FIRM|nr:type II CAAX endopeptidase family protein [Anaeromicrobium sediminis]PAB59526.1 hypothetical protein CCE28_09945 [Anaeromicrobium sediminis]
MENKKTYIEIKDSIRVLIMYIFVFNIMVVMGLGMLYEIMGKTLEVTLENMIISIVSCIFIIKWCEKRYIVELKKLFNTKKVTILKLFFMLISITGLIILLSEIDNLVKVVFPIRGMWKELFVDMFGQEHNLWQKIIAIVIVGPIVEELLFRGIILKGFMKHYSPKKAVIVSAFLFALVHMNIWQFVVAFPLGLILGWWFVKTNSIIPCILGHMFNNSIPFIITYIINVEIPGFNTSGEIVQFQPMWFNLLGLGLFSMGVILLVTIFKNDKNQIIE